MVATFHSSSTRGMPQPASIGAANRLRITGAQVMALRTIAVMKAPATPLLVGLRSEAAAPKAALVEIFEASSRLFSSCIELPCHHFLCAVHPVI